MTTDSNNYKSHELILELLRVLDDELDLMSEKTILHTQDQLWKVMAALGRAVNMHRPLTSLPVEILTRIVEEIPVLSYSDACWSLQPFYNPRFQDSSLLIPLSRTCRRLRDIALSRSSWWRHVTSSDDSIIPRILSRSGDAPLELVVKHHTGPTVCLRAFYASATPRIRGLHFLNVDYSRLKTFKLFLQLVHPELESFTCCGVNPTDPVWHRRRLCLSSDQYPRLRHAVFEGIAFRATSPLPTLTHLVLSHLSIPGLHERVANLLCSCPNLENLVVSRLFQGDFPESPPQPLLLRLRRVVLHDLVSRGLRFYLSLTSLCGEEVGRQILNETSNYGTFAFEPVLSERMQGSPTMLSIGTYSTSEAIRDSIMFSVTVANPVSALRIASTANLIGMSHYRVPGVWMERILSERALLANVQELWLFRASPHAVEVESHLSTVINALPALQTLVLVTVDYLGDDEGRVLLPELSCLPSVTNNPSFNLPNLKTLCLVQCESTPGLYLSEMDVPVSNRLDFSQMLKELASSAYCYLENLVVQVTPRFEVAQSDVEQLQEYFSKVAVERIVQPPRMPLPQCCIEEDDGPGGSCTWTRSLC